MRQQNRAYSAYIEGVGYSDELRAVLIIVRNNWHTEPYQIRLQATQNLGEMWKVCARIPANSAAPFFIGDLNGNEVGGTGLFGVYAQKE